MINSRKNHSQITKVKPGPVKGKNIPNASIKPKSRKKKKKVPKHSLIKMIFIWLLCILLGLAVAMRLWHYITYHWKS
jgi:sensor histidine kinase regulating citrate/malate metabolism